VLGEGWGCGWWEGASIHNLPSYLVYQPNYMLA
jgi:hypothetical protein